MSKSSIRKDIDVINKALNINKIAFGVVDFDGNIIVSQKYPERKLSMDEFEAEAKALGYTEIMYLSHSWRPKQ